MSISDVSQNHRVSTENLKLVDDALKVAAGCAAFCVDPFYATMAAVGGAVVLGLVGRFPMNKMPNEKTERDHLVTSICLTTLSSCMLYVLPGSRFLLTPLLIGGAIHRLKNLREYLD